MTIETTMREVDGVRFLDRVRILEPDMKRNGVGVHLISRKLVKMDENKELMMSLRTYGLRRVDYLPEYKSFAYVQYHVPFMIYKIVGWSWSAYWKTIWVSYDNARLFKQILPGDCFSWKYFTPYCWYMSIKKRVIKCRL